MSGEGSFATRHTESPAERRRARAELNAYIARVYIQCPGCDNPQAGPLHRTSERLWAGRRDRAQRNDGTDPVSGVTSVDAERHLAAIASAGIPAGGEPQ